MSDLNDSQKKIAVDNLEGMIVVDAGPGTGKTSTIVARYCNILLKDVRPSDVVLLTFTRNAAAEMEERTKTMLSEIGKADKSGELRTSTFDSFCFSVVMESPESVSRFFDMKERLTRGASTVENDTLNKTYFSDFMDRFLADRGEDYGEQSIIASQNYSDMYELISKLMSRGVMPLREGWFTAGEGDILYGDSDRLYAALDARRGDVSGTDKQHYVLSKEMSKWCKDNEIDSPFQNDVRISDETLMGAVNHRRSDLVKLVHDVYYEFIRRSVIDDRLTFGLVSIFAFVTLYSDKGVRERMSCRYLMIDEFQDTNRSQLAIALMLLKEPNLCVVGDWKQGIYGFRYVSIENITNFKKQAQNLIHWLNWEKEERVPFDIFEVKSLPLDVNYRSSQAIIDAAYSALYIPGNKEENIDRNRLDRDVVRITAGRDDIGDDTAVEFVTANDKEDEVREVLRRIQNYVCSGKYTIHERGKPSRQPIYGDIAVLCRTTNLARAISKEAADFGIPVFLQGDVDIMSSREGKLLLAWLKYVNNPLDPWGLPTILADQNYPLCEISEMLKKDGELKVPRELKDMRNEILKMKRITSKISAIFDYYKLNNDITQTLISVISSSHRGSLLTISDTIRMMETDIKEKTTYSVDSSLDKKAVILQTVHKSKGLEYPIVIVAGVNRNSFPSTKGDDSVYRFDDTMGIRCTKEIRHFGEWMTDIVPSWKTKLVMKYAVRDYDEERRLLFVALSRAQQYITVLSSTPSAFFNGLCKESQFSLKDDILRDVAAGSAAMLSERPKIDAFLPRRKNIAVHDILNFDGEDIPAEGCDEVCGKGMEYGKKVHQAAEAMARGLRPDRDYPELPAITAVLDSVKGAQVFPEKECSLPFNDIGASLRGVIDLLAVFPDRIEIHDYKTDVNRRFEDEYRLQLSVYAHAASEFFGKPAVCIIDYVSIGQRCEFPPVPRETIAGRIIEHLSV